MSRLDGPSVATAAIIVAGGRGSRLGGERKADLEIGGRTLLGRVIDAVSDLSPVVVVGDADLAVPASVLITREDPPFGGPAAGIGAGFEVIERGGAHPDWVACLAVDQPGIAKIVPELVRAAGAPDRRVEAIDAATDDAAPVNWLTSIVRFEALRRMILAAGPGGLVNGSMKRLLGPLRWARTAVPVGSTDDIDTWEDHAKWMRRLETPTT